MRIGKTESYEPAEDDCAEADDGDGGKDESALEATLPDVAHAAERQAVPGDLLEAGGDTTHKVSRR